MQITPIKPQGLALRDPHPNGKVTIFGLQALRFIAAAMVVVTHALNREVVLFNPAPMPRQPWTEGGVDIFFVISGFIMVYILKPDSKAGAFWLQRFTRIAPLYWVATAVAFAGGLLLPDWFFGRQDWGFALRSALFIPISPDPGAHPILSPGWTLIYEFAFYSLLALCLTVRRPPFVLAGAIIVLILLSGTLFSRTLPWLGYYAADWLMLEFLFGMGVARLVQSMPKLPWLGLATAAVGLALLWAFWAWPRVPRGVSSGLPAVLAVFGVLLSEPLWQRVRPMRWFARLGDASYSIYLVHFFVVTALATWFAKSPAVHDFLGPYGFVATGIVGGIGAGIAVHIFVEKPLLGLVRSWLPKRATGNTMAAAKV